MSDLFFLVVDCVAMLGYEEYSTLRNTLIGGVLFGVACWILCSSYSRLWNLRYRVTLAHHILCGMAAVLTVLFALTFVSLKYTEEVARQLINKWQLQVQADSVWQAKTFRKAYEEVKALGVEDFSQHPHPDQGGQLIPLNKEESRRTMATVYATEAVKHFEEAHPYLSRILIAHSQIPAQVINDDEARFFASHSGQIYPCVNAVNLAANHIRQGLDAQAPRVVPISRAVTVILFFLVQAVPFGLIGFAAYRDLRVFT